MKILFFIVLLATLLVSTNSLHFYLENRYCFLKDLMSEQHVLLTYNLDKKPTHEIDIEVKKKKKKKKFNFKKGY